MSGGGIPDGSLLVRLIRGIGMHVSALFSGSVTRKAADTTRMGISRLLSGSAFFRWLSRDGAITAGTDGSRVFGLQAVLLQRLPEACAGTLRRWPAFAVPGITARAIGWLADRLHLLTALFLCVVLLVPHGLWNNLYSTLGVTVLFALLLVREGSLSGPQIHVHRTGGWFFLYMLFQVLSFFSSVYPALSTRFLAFHGTDFLLVLVLVSCFRTIDELVTAVEMVVCAVSVSALYGVYQGIRGVPVKASEVDTTLNDTGVGRVFGFYDNPNNFAEILILFLPFFAALFFASTGWKRKVFYGIAAVPPLVALLMTQSRSGWGGLAVAMLVFAVFLDWRLIPVAAVAGLLVFPFLPLFLRQRVLSIFNPADTSASFRTKIWDTMWPVIRDYWWTGLGLGNDAVMKIVARYTLYTPSVPLHCHNVFLQTWVETGILGLLSLLGFLGSLAKRALRAISLLGNMTGHPMDPHPRLLVMAGLAALSGILVTSLVEYTWFYPRVMLLFWSVAGLLIAAITLGGDTVASGASASPPLPEMSHEP